MLKISKDAKVPSFVFNWSMHSWMSSNAKSWTLMSPALDPPRLKLSRRNALAASKTSGAKTCWDFDYSSAEMGAGLPTAAESRKRPAMAKVTMVFSSIYKIGYLILSWKIQTNLHQSCSHSASNWRPSNQTGRAVIWRKLLHTYSIENPGHSWQNCLHAPKFQDMHWT